MRSKLRLARKLTKCQRWHTFVGLALKSLVCIMPETASSTSLCSPPPQLQERCYLDIKSFTGVSSVVTCKIPRSNSTFTRQQKQLIDGLMRLLSVRCGGWINATLPLMAAPKSPPPERTEPRGTRVSVHRNTHKHKMNVSVVG